MFQAATCLNPQNPSNLKQVGRCLFLLGKHKDALDVYDEAQKVKYGVVTCRYTFSPNIPQNHSLRICN